MKKLYPLCEKADWKITVSLAWDEKNWKVVDLKPGTDPENIMVWQWILEVLQWLSVWWIVIRERFWERSVPLTVRFLWDGYSDPDLSLPGRSENTGSSSKAAADSITACVRELERQHQLPENSCIAMTIGGNTTMIHFLLGMDAFCVFHTPYAVHARLAGFLPAEIWNCR